MQVQVTKDAFGIAIWKPTAKLQYGAWFEQYGETKSWLASNCIFQYRQMVMSRKQSNEMFAEFAEKMSEGDLVKARIELVAE